jgi:hypothetical protein
MSQKKKDIIDGHDSQSRFGLAVAAIGDVDYDGYNGKSRTTKGYIYRNQKFYR